MTSLSVYAWLIISEGAVSLTLSCTVLFALWRFKRVEIFAIRLVAMLCMSDSLNSIGYLLALIGFPAIPDAHSSDQGKDDDDRHSDNRLQTVVCQVSGFFNQFSNMSTFIIMSLIAYSVLMTTVKAKPQREVSSKQSLFLLLGFGIPAIVAAIPATMTSFSPQTAFSCWLDERNTAIYIIFGVILYFGLLWSSYAYFIYCLIKIRRCLHKQSSICQPTLNYVQSSSPPTSKFFQRLLIFPYVTLICWIPAIVVRFLIWFTDKSLQNDERTSLLLISFDMLASILNVIIYGLNPEVRQEYRRFVFSRQSIQDYKMLDEKDRQFKVNNNPALKKLIDSSLFASSTPNLNDGNSYFQAATANANERTNQDGFYKSSSHQSPSEINYSNSNDE